MSWNAIFDSWKRGEKREKKKKKEEELEEEEEEEMENNVAKNNYAERACGDRLAGFLRPPFIGPK